MRQSTSAHVVDTLRPAEPLWGQAALGVFAVPALWLVFSDQPTLGALWSVWSLVLVMLSIGPLFARAQMRGFFVLALYAAVIALVTILWHTGEGFIDQSRIGFLFAASALATTGVHLRNRLLAPIRTERRDSDERLLDSGTRTR